MPGQRLALLIANANYQHAELRKLNAPHNEVRALEALLKRSDIGAYKTRLLIDGTKAKIEETIEELLTDGERDDTALIFFGGHGIKHENGKLYFAAIDTKPNYLGSSAVAASWLTEQMQNSRVGRQIVLLDCCFGGAFTRGHVWRGGDRVESGKTLEVPGLESEGRGQIVITSADAMQFAFEDAELNGNPATSHFVRALKEGLETGEADRAPQDGKISIEELWSYLAEKLKIMGSPQRPSKWTFGSVGGDLLFAYSPRVNTLAKTHDQSLSDTEALAQGVMLFDVQDFGKALPLLEVAANAGQAAAMLKLGEIYSKALSVDRDYSVAMSWYRKAAGLGDIEAAKCLGGHCVAGRGNEQDFAVTVACYENAGLMGNRGAFYQLGLLYEECPAPFHNVERAIECYEKAASKGSSRAITALGEIYESRRQFDKAISYYKKLAHDGDRLAKNRLASLRSRRLFGWIIGGKQKHQRKGKP